MSNALRSEHPGRCYDCNQPCADTVCATCLAAADERDYNARYCRDEHDSQCHCGDVCTTASHEAAKRDPAKLATFAFIGIMEAGDGEQLRLLNCPRCQSTVAIVEPVGVAA